MSDKIPPYDYPEIRHVEIHPDRKRYIQLKYIKVLQTRPTAQTILDYTQLYRDKMQELSLYNNKQNKSRILNTEEELKAINAEIMYHKLIIETNGLAWLINQLYRNAIMGDQEFYEYTINLK